jgi:hypothetical protein
MVEAGEVDELRGMAYIFFTIGFQLVMVKPLLIKIFQFPFYP